MLGWELATLLRGAPFDEGALAEGDGRLLRIDSLPAAMRAKLAANLIEASLRKLNRRFSGVRDVAPSRIEELHEALGVDAEGLKQAIANLHLEALFALTAADSTLGRAYALGYELADICLEPSDQCSFENAFGIQAVPVRDRLADLASSFPSHASRAVVLSLRAWEVWAAEPEIKGEPLSWGRDGAGVKAALQRQGMLWRDLLANDKHGQDMLDTGHYVHAAASLVATMAHTLRRFARPFLLPLFGLAILFVAGIVLLATGSKAAGALLAAAGALGITGAGVRARLGDVASELQSQLWGAELDVAIAEAILIGPVGWNAEVENLPARGTQPKVAQNAQTLCDLRTHVRLKSRKAIEALLAPDVEFVLPDGQTRRGARDVARWLCEAQQAGRIGKEPDAVDAITPGILVSLLDGGAAVWRVREGKVRWREGFEDAKEALERAESLGPRRLAKQTRQEANGAAGRPSGAFRPGPEPRC